MDSTTRETGSLNESQERHLLSSCQHIDKLLQEVDGILSAACTNAVFPKYRNDLSPVQIKIARDYLARIRTQMLRSLRGIGIEPPPAPFGSIHSIRVTLVFAVIALEECSPKNMRGYGKLADAVVPHLTGLLEEIRASIAQLDAYFQQGIGQDLEGRLKRLADKGANIDLLGRLERIIEQRGMVEYRSALSLILERLEAQAFEIAMFGRVSSGKSSLLNHVVEAEVLPVGVNPITAVPTRLIFGPTPRLTVWYAMKSPEVLPVDRLPEFVTEQSNRANEKHVTRIVVELPSPRLRDGVVLVDTPGLGSLATTGAAETLAYLPRCDHGVVLIDSGSTLTSDDLGTIRNLYEAGIPSSVLLSKADLLAPEDRKRAVEYTSAQIREKLGLTLPVNPVSVVAAHEALLRSWFNEQIQPLYERHRELMAESIRRKIGALRERVEAALESQLFRKRNAPGDESRLQQAETRLRLAAGEFEKARQLCDEQTDEIRSLADTVLARAADRVLRVWQTSPSTAIGPEWLSSILAEMASGPAAILVNTLRQLAEDLARALEETAAAVNDNLPPVRAEFLGVLKDMPLLDLGLMRIELHPGFLGTAWPGLAKRQVEKQLRTQFGEQISGAFYSYGKILEAWSRRSLESLRNRFDSYADSYRVQLGRPSAAGDPYTQEALRRDLEFIRNSEDTVIAAVPGVDK